MIVVADTSPLNYLVLIEADHVLPALFGQVIAPPAVLIEMQHAKAPLAVKQWAASPPPWLSVRPSTMPIVIGRLVPGEAEAISLAQECRADAILMDDRDGTAVAMQLGLAVIGTLAILDSAADRDLIFLPHAIASLRQTTFRGPEQVMQEMLDRDRRRRSSKPSG